MSGTLIVGAGQAGLQLAVSLRQMGDAAAITLIGEESHAPYQRPPLSKEFLAGTAGPQSLQLRSPAFYADNGIELLRGEGTADVTLSRLGQPGSGTVLTTTGRSIAFDRLALTTGAAARRLTLSGADLDGICYLRGHDDAADLRVRLSRASRVVVVGGGFIGLEAAATARAAGLEVAVVEAGERLMARAVGAVVSDFYLEAHRRRGVRVLLSCGVTGFAGDDGGRVTGVLLDDGTQLPADLVLVGVGVVPRTEVAEWMGLLCEGGIVVDSCARTSEPGVVAAGDCTVRPDPMTGLGRVRLESVQNAISQAQSAAATLLGRPAEVRAVPWFWSNQGSLRLQIAGLSAGHDMRVVRGTPEDEQFSVLYYRAGRLLAADAVNSPADYMAVRKALSTGATLPADQAIDPGIPLKSLLTPVAGPA
jgi:3-phenylpropionate/trans-cinnamate dioxygenase ferredoxin reductase subunit